MPFSISDKPIDPAALRENLACDSAGAFVAFEGWVRNHNEGKNVDALDYSAYDALAEKEGSKIIAEAEERFAIEAAVCVHRVGELQIGDLAVWTGVSAGHREEAFEACRYIIDEVKARVPIWKREHYQDGETTWVNCATST